MTHRNRTGETESQPAPGRNTARTGTQWILLSLVGALLLSLPSIADAQIRIGDLTLQEQNVPVRLMGYGLVVGLDGTGDRTTGARGGGQTVQSVANLLRRFDILVPAELLRTRNVAAVLVTAEVSPYLRPGGRFEVHVSSLGDARSVRGGVLWMTPLVAEVGGSPVASAQGALLVSDGGSDRGGYTVETTARIPQGGILEGQFARPSFASSSRLLLREPELRTATRIAELVNNEIGPGTAAVEDPGSVALNLPDDMAARVDILSQITDLRIEAAANTRIIIDGRDGTVVAGGDLAIGEAVVSHGLVTLTIGDVGGAADVPGGLQVPAGTSAQQVAAALHAFQTPPREIAAIFEALREVGALSAEVIIR